MCLCVGHLLSNLASSEEVAGDGLTVLFLNRFGFFWRDDGRCSVVVAVEEKWFGIGIMLLMVYCTLGPSL
jgi:hypothetical protein